MILSNKELVNYKSLEIFAKSLVGSFLLKYDTPSNILHH